MGIHLKISKITFKNENKYDLQKENVIINHKYYNSIKNKYKIIDFNERQINTKRGIDCFVLKKSNMDYR